MSAVSVKRALNDNVNSNQDVNMNPETEQAVPSDQNHTDNLPTFPLLDLHSSPVSPPSDQVYLQAAAIFKWLQAEKPAPHHLLQYREKTDIPLSGSGDKNTQKQAFQLAFSTLKYQELLLDVIANSHLQKCPHMDSDLLPLAMVMLFDLQERKFALQELSPQEGQDVFQEVRDLQRSLQKCKTKLAANLARFRVKHRLRSVSCFLPDSVRTKQMRAKILPLYAWINIHKISLADICEGLQSASLTEAQNITELTELAFCKDPLCPDTLVFHQSLQARLLHSSLTATHVVNIQDRSLCLAVRVLQPLLYEKADVLVVGSFSALTVAHIATVAASRGGRLLVCGTDHTPSQVKEMQELLAQMEIQNVQILSEAFSNLSEWDTSAQMIRVIAVLPQCSSSALNDPVPTMHSEHGDWTLLPELSQGSVSSCKMLSLTAKQSWLLGHALTFPKVQTVLYCTRSEYPEENEDLVRKVLEKARTHPKLLPFRVSGPVFPDDSPSGATADPRFFRLAPSHLTNGCFIARLSRQADPTKVETVQDVLARAAAKGLLGGIIPEPPRGRKKGKSKKTQAASSTSKPSSPSEKDKREGEDYEYPTSEQGEEVQQEDFGEDGEKVNKKKGENKKKRKRAAKKQTRKSDSVPKKSTKKKGNQSHKKLSKPKQIPRLTLASISSDKPSSSLTLITALAHKISSNPAGQSQQTESSSAASVTSAPRRPNIQQAGAETLKDTTKHSRLGRQETAGTTQGAERPKDHVLPPIPCLASSSPCNKSRSSVSQSVSSQPASTSASVSSISLPDI